MTEQRIGIYAGSFDPFTYGHLEIAERAAPLFDRLHLSAGVDPTKNGGLFSPAARIDLVDRMLAEHGSAELRAKAVVDCYDTLLVRHARALGARWVVRGLRAASDFEAEFTLNGVSRTQDNGVQMVYMMTTERFMFVSSRTVKELVRFGGDVSQYVPDFVADAVRARLAPSHE